MKPFPKPKTHTHKTRKAGMFLLSLLAVAGMLLAVFFAPLTERGPEDDGILFFPGQGNAAEGHLPDMREDEIREQMQKKADASHFAFKINPSPVFNSGGEGDLRIENPNHNTYPFVVEITLNETGEKVYDSGGILPDHHIARDTLTRALPTGVYMATAYFHVYDPDTSAYRGKAAAALVLQVRP